MITGSTDLKPCHKNQNCINKWTFNMQFMLNFAKTGGKWVRNILFKVTTSDILERANIMVKLFHASNT